MRVPWTARRSNQSILKAITPGCSLEGLMLKLKLQYFGHLMRRADSLEKTLMLGNIRFPLPRIFLPFHTSLFFITKILLSSVQFSRSVVSDSLQPHEPQHARPPCPSPTPGVYPNSCPLSCDAIQPSHPLSSPSPPALNLSQHQGLFK